ncbi:hypothetical protein BC936DRAFT_147793, partial [Jimgerdemannia flammicorona]
TDGVDSTPLVELAPITPPALLHRYHDLQRQHKAIVAQNQHLEQECTQLQLLVREYEAGMEVVTDKFKSHGYSSQQEKLLMQRDYEVLLDEERMQHRLVQLATLLRQAHDVDADSTSTTLIEHLLQENRALREKLGIAGSSPPSSAPSSGPTCPAARTRRASPQQGPSVLVAEFFGDEGRDGLEGGSEVDAEEKDDVEGGGECDEVVGK